MDADLSKILHEIKTIVSEGKAKGGVYCVDSSTGSDSNNGQSWGSGNALLTISAAMTLIASDGYGGTVYVKGGTYNEDVSLPANSSLVGIPVNHTDVVIGGAASSSDASLVVGSNSFVENLRVTKQNDDFTVNYVVNCLSGARLTNITVASAINQTYAIYVGEAGTGEVANNVIIDNVKIQGFSTSNRFTNGIYGQGDSGKVTNCQFYGVSGNGIVIEGNGWLFKGNRFSLESNMYAIDIANLINSFVTFNYCLPYDNITQGGSTPSNQNVAVSNNGSISGETLTEVYTYFQDFINPIRDIDFGAIAFDFTTYTKAVMLFYNANRPSLGTPTYWCYVYTAAGARPINSGEIVLRDVITSWASSTPT